MATVVYGVFEWDSDKAARNIERHGVGFYEAADALESDAFDVALPDRKHPERANTIVMSDKARVLYVVTTETDVRTRIISARKASSHERQTYAQARRRR